MKKVLMSEDIISVSYLGSYFIELTFEDGTKGVVDFSKYLSKGGVFEKFKDIDFFKNFTINRELGVLTWAEEIQIAPETLYAEASGSSLPDWMKVEQSSEVKP